MMSVCDRWGRLLNTRLTWLLAPILSLTLSSDAAYAAIWDCVLRHGWIDSTCIP